MPDYRHLFSRVDERGLARLLELALDRGLIAKLCHICGLVQEGKDLAPAATQALAAQLARDCFEREVTAAQVASTLVQTSAREISRVGATSPGRIGSLLGDRTSAYSRECGRLATAMLLDERASVHAPAIELLNRTSADGTRPGIGVSEETAFPYLRGDAVLDGEAAGVPSSAAAQDLGSANPAAQDLGSTIPAAQDLGSTIQDTVKYIETHCMDVLKALKAVRQEVDQLSNLRHDSDQDGPIVRGQLAFERVAIFIDVQNMWYAARQHYGISARLDFEKLLQAAVGERRLICANAYVIQTPEVDQSGFVTMLEQFSYQVKRKDLRRRSDGSAKGDWDMEMAIDMIRMAEKVDVIILASGDGDFVSLIQLLKELGPRVEVFSFPHNTARDLMEAADRYKAIGESLLIDMHAAR